MILLRPTRPLRSALGVVLAVCLVTGVLVAVTVGSSGRAEAGTTGGPYGVYASVGPTLSELPVNALGGGPSTVDSSGSGLNTGAVAINTTATLGAVTIQGDGANLSNVDIFTVPGNSVIGTIRSLEPAGFAMDPVNPGLAFAVDFSGNVYSLALAAGTVPAPAPLLNVNQSPSTSSASCSSVAVNPSGTILVASCVDYPFSGAAPTPYLVAVSVPSRSVAGTWFFPSSVYTPVDVAISADGSAVYAVASSSSSARIPSVLIKLPINFNAKTAVTWSRGLAAPVRIPTSVTLSVDGATVYVGGTNGAGVASGVAAFSAATGTPGPSASVNLITGSTTNTGLTSIALTPDGRTLLAFGASQIPGTTASDDHIYPVSVTPSALGVGAASASLGSYSYPYGPQGLAVTPDQAPVANLLPASGTAGKPLTLNASSSTIVYGSITRYVWSFGDGSPSVTTAGPSVSHTYGTPGNYIASVVETDSAGTSVPPAPFAPGAVNGPGTTPYLDASPAAAISAPVAIGKPNGPPPPVPTTAPNNGTTSTTVKNAPPASYHPVVNLDSPLGSPGSIVTVTGQGFPPNKNVKVEWSTNTASFEESTDSHGNLPAHIIFILTPDVLGPRFAVATVTGTSLSAQAPFLVVPGSAQPGGNSGDVLFRSEGP